MFIALAYITASSAAGVTHTQKTPYTMRNTMAHNKEYPIN
jgi:hypothetical protein